MHGLDRPRSPCCLSPSVIGVKLSKIFRQSEVRLIDVEWETTSETVQNVEPLDAASNLSTPFVSIDVEVPQIPQAGQSVRASSLSDPALTSTIGLLSRFLPLHEHYFHNYCHRFYGCVQQHYLHHCFLRRLAREASASAACSSPQVQRIPLRLLFVIRKSTLTTSRWATTLCKSNS